MAYRDEVLADSPVIYWELEQTSGTPTNAGSEALGTVTVGANVTRNVAGRVGQAWSFDGTTASYVGVNDADAKYTDKIFTVEAWVKTTSTSKIIASMNVGGTHYWYLYVTATGTALCAIKGSNSLRSVDSGITINDDAWHHVAMVVSGDTSLTIYVDGVNRGSQSSSIGTFSTFSTGQLQLSANTTNSITGTIDEFAVYDSALSGTRIAAHYNAAPGAAVNGGYTAQSMTASGLVNDPGLTAWQNGKLTDFILEDSYTRSGATDQNTNYGSATELQLGHSSLTVESWFKSVNRSLPTVAPGNQLTMKLDAVLNAYDYNNLAGISFQIYRVDATWSEGTITHANKPAKTLIATVSPTFVSNVNIATGPRKVRVSIDLAALAAEWSTVKTNGFVIKQTAGNFGDTLDSSESSNAPTLVFEDVNPDATVNATPLTSTSSMPDPVVEATDTVSVSASPLTADGLLLDPVVTAETDPNASIAAPVMTADSILVEPQVRLPKTVSADPMTASGQSYDGTVSSDFNALVRPEPMTASVEFIPQESPRSAGEDPYYKRIWDTTTTGDLWFRLDEASGNIAMVVDGRGNSGAVLGEQDRSGFPDPDYTYEYVGNVQFGGVGPESRKAVKFVDGYLNRESSFTNQIQAFEVVFRTTQDGVIAWGSQFGVTPTTTTGPFENLLDINGGKIRLSNLDLNETVTGFKTVTDGQWHHLVIMNNPIDPLREADQRDLNKGLRVFIDGQLDIRRAANVKVSIPSPDTLFGAPSTVLNAEGVSNFNGDVMEVVLRSNRYIYNDDAIALYYDAFGFTPFHAEPMGAVGAMGDHKGKGNRKRALMISFTDSVQETDQGREDLAFGPGISYRFTDSQPALNSWPREFGEYKLFYVNALHPTYSLNSRAWIGQRYDRVTGVPRLLNLQEDIDVTDYDVIFFQSWPDESSEYYADLGFEYEQDFRKLVEDLGESVKQAIVDGANVWVQSPTMAQDIGIIDTASLVPTMRDLRRPPASISNYFSEFYGDDHAKEIYPWTNEGAYFRDTHANNRLRITANIEGLTDLPGTVIDDLVVLDRLRGLGDSYRYAHKFRNETALTIGDEFVNGTLYEESFNAELAQGGGFNDAFDENWNYNFYAVPPNAVRAGTVVARLGAKVWQGNVEIDNPYAEYASAIVLRPGDILGGKQISGRVFVNLSENASWATATLVDQPYKRQIVPPNEQINYAPDREDADKRAWDYSEARWSTTSTAIQLGKKFTPTSQPADSTGQTKDFGEFDGMTVNILTYFEKYDTEPVHVMTLTERGLTWLGADHDDDLEGTVVRPIAVTAEAEMPQPTVVAERSNVVSAEPMRALGVIVNPDEVIDPDVQVFTFAMEATGAMGGFGRTIHAEPMTATGEIVEVFDLIYTSGEQAVVYLYDVEAVVYMKEE